MKDFKINNKGSAALFTNRFLERLSRTNFIVPVIFYLLVGIGFISYVAVKETYSLVSFLLLVPAGMILFTLVEYLVHRFIFHFHAVSEKELKIQYNIHGVHHEFPRDKSRLVMPPVISIVLSTFFFFLFYLLLDKAGMILFGGFVSGYSIYLIIHYAVHAKKPPNNFLRYLWKHHSLHHYSSVHSAFSVSFPLWDHLFKTMPPNKEMKHADRLPDNL